MVDGKGGDTINPWALALFQSAEASRTRGPPAEQAAYSKWLDQTIGPRERPERPAPRRGGHHPDLDLARPVPDRGRRLRLHAVLRGQRRGRALPGDADGLGDHGDRAHAGWRSTRSTTPTAPASGQIKPVAMERSLRILDAARAVVTTATRFRATPGRSGRVLMDDRDENRFDRHFELAATVLLAMAAVATAWASYQSARWHGEQAQGAERVDRRPRRVDARGERGQPAGGRSTSRCSRSGSTPTPATRPSSPPSTASAFARSSGRRSTPGSRPGRGRTPTPRCRRSRCRSTSSRPPRRPTASRQRPPRPPSGSGRSSSAPTTTRWPSCCSPRRCSSRASARGCTRHARGWSSSGSATRCSSARVIWIATFPVSLSV